MPSPFAHASLVFLAVPVAERGRPLTLSRRLVLASMIAFVMVLPDLDFLLMLINPSDASSPHGSWTHSLVWTIPVGVLFALIARTVWPKPQRPGFARLALIGAAGYASHILMDWMNWGFGNARGVSLFWPVLEDRFRSPVSVFVGVRWSEPGAYLSHLLTLITEIAFAAFVLAISVLRARRTGAAAE